MDWLRLLGGVAGAASVGNQVETWMNMGEFTLRAMMRLNMQAMNPGERQMARRAIGVQIRQWSQVEPDDDKHERAMKLLEHFDDLLQDMRDE
jgi:hypothetical protein